MSLPNALLVTIDSMRADRLGALRAGRSITPALDRLASHGVAFKNAYARGIPTFCSFPAVMASRSPFFPEMRRLGIESSDVTLAEHLQTHGYQTAAFVSRNPYLSRVCNYDRGFESFRDYFHIPESAPQDARTGNSPLSASGSKALGSTLPLWARNALRPIRDLGRDLFALYLSGNEYRPYTPSHRIVQDCLNWIESRASNQPFFVWLHFMDVHAPYFPDGRALRAVGGGRMSRFSQSRANATWRKNWHARTDQEFQDAMARKNEILMMYDACIRTVDEQVGHLFDGLARRGLERDLCFAITADHGEEFFDHGNVGHRSDSCYEELIRVPLIMSGRANEPVGDVTDSLVSLMQIAPTICDLCGVPASSTWQGQSLLAVPQSTITCEALGIANAEVLKGFDRSENLRTTAIIEGGCKVILNRRTDSWEVYDLRNDPGERANLAEGDWSETASRLRQKIEASEEIGLRSELRRRIASMKLKARPEGATH